MRRLGLLVIFALVGCGASIVLGPPQAGGSSAWRCPRDAERDDGALTAECTLDPVVDESRVHVAGDHYPLPDCPAGIRRIVVEDGVALVECNPAAPETVVLSAAPNGGP